MGVQAIRVILLARGGSDFYVADMKFATVPRFLFVMLAAGLFTLRAFSQGLQVDVEEFKRLQGEVADLRDAHSAQQRRISELNRRVDSLQEALKEANQRAKLNNEDFVTREALKKVLDQVAEVDQKREADRKVVLEQLEKLGKALSQPPMRGPRESSGTRKEKDPGTNNDTAEVLEGKFIPRIVEEGEYFSGILEAYNEFLKKEGRPPIKTADVKRANPGLNPDRIRKGQEILLPLPDKK
jgi:TolA-binding protein